MVINKMAVAGIGYVGLCNNSIRFAKNILLFYFCKIMIISFLLMILTTPCMHKWVVKSYRIVWTIPDLCILNLKSKTLYQFSSNLCIQSQINRSCM